MSQNAIPSAPSGYLSSAEGNKVSSLRVDEDPAIKGLKKLIRRRGLLPEWAVWLGIGITSMVFGAILILTHIDGLLMRNPPDKVGVESWTCVIFGCLTMAMGIVLFYIMHDRIERKAGKSEMVSIRRSRKAAHELGTGIVPVLTKSHVEARVRVDDALRLKREEFNLRWDRNDSDRIGKLLFKDLNREPVITSLITDRDMIDAQEIEATLLEVESNTAAPVRSGWL